MAGSDWSGWESRHGMEWDEMGWERRRLLDGEAVLGPAGVGGGAHEVAPLGVGPQHPLRLHPRQDAVVPPGGRCGVQRRTGWVEEGSGGRVV